MALIDVKGTPVQPVLDGASDGDVIRLAAGGYAGPLRIRKALTLEGNGATIDGPGKTLEISAAATVRGLTLQGSTGANMALVSVTAPGVTLEDLQLRQGECFGIRLYRSDRLTLRRLEIAYVGAAVRVDSGGAGSSFEDVYAHDLNRMVSDTASGNGGDAFQFVASTGPINVIRPRVVRARAKATLASWQYDGGAFQFYNACRDVTISDWYVENSVNVIETGKDAGAGDSVGVILRNGKAVGNGGPHTSDKALVCNGILLRSARDFRILDNAFDGLDDWTLYLTGGGTYGGALGGNRFTGNTLELKEAPSKAYVSTLADLTALRAAITIGANTVRTKATGQAVALLSGKPWTAPPPDFVAESWGMADPCDALRRERDEAMHALGLLQTELALTQAKIEAAKAALG